MSEPLRIIVADDEHDVRLLLRVQLGVLADIDLVAEAADGAVCLELCRELLPDAVVMDLLMPKIDGFAAIAQLREDLPQIGLVAYTAVAGEFVRHEMGRIGIEVVLKSGDVSALADALRRSVNPPQDAPAARRRAQG